MISTVDRRLDAVDEVATGGGSALQFRELLRRHTVAVFDAEHPITGPGLGRCQSFRLSRCYHRNQG
jgi:hypothetical protein